MIILRNAIKTAELKKYAENKFGNLVKAVVDINLCIMAIDAELHADEEALLIEQGSSQQDLWGINIYPDLKRNEWIEYDSMINLRPAQGNRSRGIDDLKIKETIDQIVNKLIEP